MVRMCAAMLICMSLLVAQGSVIFDAPTITSYQRGFDTDPTFSGKMTKQEIMDTLRDTRQVIVADRGNSFDSFLQEEEEEESPRDIGKMPFQLLSPDPAIRKTHACGQCKPKDPSCKPCLEEVVMSAGPLHFHVIKNLQRHSLIRSVKYGFEPLAPWNKAYPVKREPDEVYYKEIKFPVDGPKFVTRPIILAAVMPECGDAHHGCDEAWTDVFALSLSHVSTVGFAVNIMRVDSLPNNSWGQALKVSWIAFEPNDHRAYKTDLNAGKNDAHVTLHA